jgi:hypothetical protein
MGTVPDTDPELEARALADATGFKRVEGRTCHYPKPMGTIDAGKAFGIPSYAFMFDTEDPVRVPGIGYGYKTLKFVGKPVDSDCATGNWSEASLQDNSTYYIVKITWPVEHEYWVKGSHVQDIDANRVVTFVETVNDFDRTLLDVSFTLHPDTLITNADGVVEPLMYYQPADQAAINYTFARQCLRR